MKPAIQNPSTPFAAEPHQPEPRIVYRRNGLDALASQLYSVARDNGKPHLPKPGQACFAALEM